MWFDLNVLKTRTIIKFFAYLYLNHNMNAEDLVEVMFLTWSNSFGFKWSCPVKDIMMAGRTIEKTISCKTYTLLQDESVMMC
jgi:hypothetical protein